MVKISGIRKKVEFLTFGLLIFFLSFGIYLRTSGTLRGYFAFTFDQGRDFLQWHELSRGHISLLGPPTGIDGVFHGVWWHWLIASFFILFRGDPLLVVASFNLLSSAIILIAYFLGKILKDRWLGIILAGIVAVSPFFYSTGAQLWHPNLVPLITILLLIAVWQKLQGKWSYLPVAAVLGLIFEFEIGYAGLFLPAFFIASLIFRIWPQTIKESFLSIGAFMFWLLPRLVFELRHGFIQFRSFFRYLSPGRRVDQAFIARIVARLDSFIHVIAQTYAAGNKFISLGILLLVFIFILKSWREKAAIKKLQHFLVIIILLFLLVASIYPQALWDYYLIGIPALCLPLVGWVFYLITKKTHLLGWVVYGIWLIFLLTPWLLSRFEPWIGDHSVYKNQLAVVENIYQDADHKPFNVSVYSPSVIDYTYHYLFLWYGMKNYGYTPDRDTIQKLVYYVVEPEIWNPPLKEAWLRERVGDGTIIWRQTYPGGIDVEKRIR